MTTSRIGRRAQAAFDALLRFFDAFGTARVQGYRDRRDRATPRWEHLATQERVREASDRQSAGPHSQDRGAHD